MKMIIPDSLKELKEYLDTYKPSPAEFERIGFLTQPFICSMVANNRLEIVELLLDYGVSPNSRTMYANTLLHIAKDPAMIKLLLERGADPDLRNEWNDKSSHPYIEVWRKEKETKLHRYVDMTTLYKVWLIGGTLLDAIPRDLLVYELEPLIV